MKFDEIVDAFKANLLEKHVKKHGPQPFESCWAELVENEYDRKVALVTQLIKSGVDCDWRNDKGITPMELALALNKPKLVAAMLEAETARFDTPRMVYRLVRRGNVELLRTFFEMQRVSETDKFRMVSLALEEGVVKGVNFSREMHEFCGKLILRTFYGTRKITKLSSTQRKQHIRKRIEIVCKEVEFLQSYGTECFTNIDNNFLASMSIVAENLNVIDLLWKHPSLTKLKQYAVWCSLQPTKINYLIMIYVDVLTDKLHDLGLAIDKNLVLDMLNMLGSELKVIYTKNYEGIDKMENFLVKMVRHNNVNEGWNSKYPQFKLTKQHRRFARKQDYESLARAGFNTEQQQHLLALVHSRKNFEQLCELWIQKFPKVRLGTRAVAWATGKGGATSSGPFSSFSRRTRYVLKTVNKIYRRVKNYYSLFAMLYHIHEIYNISLTERMAKEFGFAAFQRIVQVMGEFCKNTQQTPNMHGALHQHISLWSSQSLLQIFHHRRNVVTHGLSLTEVNFRILQNSGELDASILLECCQMVQSELQKIYSHLKYYLLSELTRLIRGCLGRIWRLRCMKQRESFATMMARVKQSNWKDISGDQHGFDEMNSLLNILLSRKEDRHLHDCFREVKTKLQQSKTTHEEYISSVEKHQTMAWKLIESCGKYCDYNVLHQSLKAQLTLPQKYYLNGNELLFLKQANQLLVTIEQRKQYSQKTAQYLVQLNRLIVNKVDRESQLKPALQINQFVPYQNERYTESLLESLGVKDLSFEKFYAVHDALESRVYDPVNKQHEVGMLAVEQKFNVIKRVLLENDIKYNPQLVDKGKMKDSRLIQRLLEQMLESLYQLSRVKVAFEDQYFGARVLATQYGLLEVCTVLSHTVPFRSNFNYFNTPIPLLAGKYLRNALAHDFVLCKSAFSFTKDTINQTIEVLYEQRSSLLNEQNKFCALPHFGEITEKYRRRKRLAEYQTIPTKDKLSKILNSRLDIYGHYFFVWKEESNYHHNLLDVLLYYYKEEAIAYIEERSQQNGTSSASSVFSYLWNRLRYSQLLGWPLQPIAKLFSFSGMNTAVSHQDGLAEEIDRIWQRLEQIEKILCYFLVVKRFDKFLEYFHRYGETFDFVKFHTLLSDIPDVVDKLAKFLPWGSVNNQGFSMMHSLCASNNVEALKSAIKRLSSKKLSICSEEGLTPLYIAAWHSSLEAIRILLESKKHTNLDAFTLARIVETHQNDLLKYFIPLLESDQSQKSLSLCSLRVAATANIDAYKILNKKLSATAKDGNFQLIHYATLCGTKKSFLQQLLIDPYLKSIANQRDSPMLIDIRTGRFKYTDILLSNGFAVDFSVILGVVRSNCFKRLKWLLRRSELVLTDSQQQEICKEIISYGLDLRMLKYFTGLNALPQNDLTRMLEYTLQHGSFDNCRFMCETFPQILKSSCSNNTHPIRAAINEIHRNNSLSRDRPFLSFLIEKCTNIAQQQTLLLKTLKLGDLQIVQALVDAGVPIDIEVADFTPLSQAAHNCATYPNAQAYAIFELLLKKGVSVQNLVFRQTRYLQFVRLLELLIKHTTFGAASKELLIVLLHVQVIGSERVMQALLRKYKFLVTTLSFDRNERLVLDSQFKVVLSQYEFDCMIERIIDSVKIGIYETPIKQTFDHPKFDYKKLFK